MPAALRIVVAVVILGLLARSARFAWRNRDLAATVWRRMRPRHVLGSIVLLGVVVVVASLLILAVPLSGVSLGSLIGLTGNAVFAPVEQVAGAGGPTPTAGVDAAVWIATAAFLLLLLALFPWLAYVEERMFRHGLERGGLGTQLWTALRFGLVHLVMLVPLAAALAVGVAGFFYGRVYLRTFHRVNVEHGPAAARSEAVLASAVWHATFNSLIVVMLLVLLVVDGSLV